MSDLPPPDPSAPRPAAREDSPDMADRALLRRRREDAAIAVPLLGAGLLVSPILNAVAGIDSLLGVPAPFLYVFAVWLGLILLTRGLSRRLAGSEPRG